MVSYRSEFELRFRFFLSPLLKRGCFPEKYDPYLKVAYYFCFTLLVEELMARKEDFLVDYCFRGSKIDDEAGVGTPTDFYWIWLCWYMCAAIAVVDKLGWPVRELPRSREAATIYLSALCCCWDYVDAYCKDCLWIACDLRLLAWLVVAKLTSEILSIGGGGGACC